MRLSRLFEKSELEARLVCKMLLKDLRIRIDDAIASLFALHLVTLLSLPLL